MEMPPPEFYTLSLHDALPISPRLRWPTSELPICPSGRPTARPQVVSVVCGNARHSASNTGVRASSTALPGRSEEHTSELQSRRDLVCRLLLEKKKMITYQTCI